MIQILLAILAGVVTIAAPCILPLLPILLGTAVGQTSKTRPLFIVLGFIFVFSLAGLALSFLTSHLGIQPNTLRLVAIAVLGLFGLCMVWPLPFELLMVRVSGVVNRAGTMGRSAGKGNLGGFVLGMTLGIVWTPCAGPVLGSVLALIALQRQLVAAGILLTAYALGAAVPMLLIAYGGQYLASRVKPLVRYAKGVQQGFGALIILLAVALYFNYDTKIYSVLLEHYPTFNPQL